MRGVARAGEGGVGGWLGCLVGWVWLVLVSCALVSGWLVGRPGGLLVDARTCLKAFTFDPGPKSVEM